jgi:hypothetical protein
LKPSPQIDEPSFWPTGSKTIADEPPEEILIADQRAGLTPADIVEQRFRALLDKSSLKVGMPRISLPRTEGRARRTIAYVSRGGPRAGANRRKANPDHGESTMYAISVERELATEILTRLRPWPCRFWQTDYRGLLLIHARTRKPSKGFAASEQSSASNALVGMVELMDCIPAARPGADPDENEYHWLLANPCTFDQPLPYPGRLGLYLVSEMVVAAALRQAATSRRPQQ